MKTIFVPTYLEVGEEWLNSQGFIRQDNRKETPAVYRKGDSTIVVAGMALEPTYQALAILKEEGLFDHPSHFMLAGTAGSYTIPVMSIRNCLTSFPSISLGYDNATAVTVHEFVSPDSPHPELHVPDVCFEMEAEAYLNVLASLPAGTVKSFTMVKLISDDGSGNLTDWRKYTQEVCQPHVQKILLKYLNTAE